MQLAFSTLGTPGASLDQILRIATRGGYQGIELRAWPGELINDRMTAGTRAAARRRIESAGLTLLTVASYVRLAGPGADASVLGEAHRAIELAHDLGARRIRVFGGGDPHTDVITRARHRLAAASTVARAAGVRLLLETHDTLSASSDVLAVVTGADHTHVGVIWDVVNPWRVGEHPNETWRRLRPWLGYIQVKDISCTDTLHPALLGAGIFPLRLLIDVLRDGGYDGWWCVEWEKAWFPDIAAPEHALPAAARWLRHQYLPEPVRRTP